MTKTILTIIFLSITALSEAQAENITCSSARCSWRGDSGQRLCDIFSTSFSVYDFTQNDLALEIRELVYDEFGKPINFRTVTSRVVYTRFANSLIFKNSDALREFNGTIGLTNSQMPPTGKLGHMTVQSKKDVSSNAAIDYWCY